MMAENDGTERGRRGFFRAAFSHLLQPVADMIEKRLPILEPTPRLLRPPGAIDETRFVDTCMRCGKCVEVCPAQAIRPWEGLDRVLAGTPHIDANRTACVVCDGLQCTHVCPSGALLPVLLPSMIAMGLAEVNSEHCVRSIGESCTICVDRCPLGPAAIRFDGVGPPTVLSPGCVGCGVCQEHCPTTPKAIVVRAK